MSSISRGSWSFAHTVKNSPRIAVTRSGVDSDLYLLDDILHPDFQAPRVLWFVDSLELTPEKAAEIRRRYADSGRILVWMWAPGAGVTDDIGKVAGFRLERAPMADGLPVMALSNSGDPLMAGVRNLLLASYMPYGMGPVWKVSEKSAFYSFISISFRIFFICSYQSCTSPSFFEFKNTIFPPPVILRMGSYPSNMKSIHFPVSEPL